MFYVIKARNANRQENKERRGNCHSMESHIVAAKYKLRFDESAKMMNGSKRVEMQKEKHGLVAWGVLVFGERLSLKCHIIGGLETGFPLSLLIVNTVLMIIASAIR